jgi:NAD(P)-dependent dehydrogenase (short-subunit alcohol dehydrogenase family)
VRTVPATERVALVTGAAGGVGGAVVSRLADLGWRVFAGVRSPEQAKAVDHPTGGVTPLVFDITDEEAIAQAREELCSELAEARLEGLVNSAGAIVQGPLELVPIHALRRQLDVNLLGQLAVTQAFLPLVRSANGRVVYLGGGAGRVALPGYGALSASKAALAAAADALRLEVRAQGVSVSVVEPGALATDIFKKASEAARRDGSAGDETTRELYRELTSRVASAMSRRAEGSVDLAVDAVIRALSDRRPRPRCTVGRDARQIALLPLVPPRARDRILTTALHLPGSVRAGRRSGGQRTTQAS